MNNCIYKSIASKSACLNLVKLKIFKNIVVYVGIFMLSVIVFQNESLADQQRWASQYMNWTFDSPVANVYNIDQQIWLAQPNKNSFWPLQWSWEGSVGVGGYLGLLQENTSANQIVRFSLWNATGAMPGNGASCRPFDGEGIGYTCTLPVTIDTGKFYRVRLWGLNSVNDGQWWGAWLIEKNTQGGLTERYIGKIKVPLAYGQVKLSSITNFVEYWGNSEGQCKNVPPSVAGFTPPAVNYHGGCTGTYSGYSTYAGSNPAPDNICVNGNESQGAFITARNHNFGFATGAMTFLGGQTKNPPSWPAANPPDMPNC